MRLEPGAPLQASPARRVRVDDTSLPCPASPVRPAGTLILASARLEGVLPPDRRCGRHLGCGHRSFGPGPPLGVRGPEARWARPLVTSVLAGVGAFGLFYGAAHLARRAPLLERAVSRALAYEIEGSTPLVLLTTGLNGIAEEMFYRGALWSIVADSNPIAKTTLAYTAATAATRNLALVFAGTATSLLFGYQRRAMGGVLGPTITHLTWSMLMLRYLPPLFGASGGRPDAATART